MDLADQVFVGHDEGTEIEGVGLADARHEQGARSVALLLVDSEPEPDVLVVDDTGLATAAGVLDEGGVQRRNVAQGADDGEADEMGETDLRPGGPGQLVVENLAVHLEQARRNGAHARRRRNARGWPPCWPQSARPPP